MSSSASLTGEKKLEDKEKGAAKCVSSIAVQPPVNEAWRLCMEHRWVSLQMRLGMFPDEARQVQLTTKRSLLHEIVSIAAMEARGAKSDCTSRGNHDGRHDRQIYADIVTPLVLRSVYFSCPQAMLLLDSIKGYTPLHCALVIEGSASTVASAISSISKASIGTDEDLIGDGYSSTRHHNRSTGSSTTSSSSDFDLVRSLLDLSLGRCAVENEDDDDDSLLFDDNDDDNNEEEKSNDEEDDEQIIINEEAVLLLRDALIDTPLHTACRHGCSKHVLRSLMEACPSALFHYNIGKMTPLRLLWHNLEERMRSNKKNSNINSSNANTYQSVANVVPKSTKRSKTLSELEEILVNKINSYKDLTNYPAIHETWEKSLLLLHLYRTSLSKSTTLSNDSGDVSTEFRIPQSVTHSQIGDLIDGSKMTELMPQDTYCDFLKRAPYIIMKDYPTGSSTKADTSCEDVLQHPSEPKGLQEPQIASTGKRKRLTSFYVTEDNHHHSSPNVHINSNKQTAQIDFMKGIQPDENGVIPMPSYKTAHDENVEKQYNASRTSSHHNVVDEPNLFFALDD